jgi:hypothetical protein
MIMPGRTVLMESNARCMILWTRLSSKHDSQALFTTGQPEYYRKRPDESYGTDVSESVTHMSSRILLLM